MANGKARTSRNEPTLDAQGAKRAEFPEWIEPQLATLTKRAPVGDQWLHEMKFDGYRLLMFHRDESVKFFTRNQLDWTGKFESLVPAVHKLGHKQMVLDGEVCVLNENGVSSFKALQQSLSAKSGSKLLYFAFDILYCDGRDLRSVPLVNRKKLLADVLSSTESPIHYVDYIIGNGEQVLKAARDALSEGIISKLVETPYRSGRHPSWLKTKCRKEEEFLIVGYTEHSRNSDQIGALLLGQRKTKQSELVYCGKVGTGFSEDDRTKLQKTLLKSEIKNPGVQNVVGISTKNVTWTEPVHIAQIQFTEKTADGLLRHPTFLGLRKDLRPGEIVEAKAI